MKIELWKPIKGYENRYLISNHGRVISLPRIILAKDGFLRNYPKRLLKLTPNKTRGYIAVRLYDEHGKYKHIEIHRLVALHFLENPDGLPLVNHIDTVRHNNHVANLEWCTYATNILHKGAHRKGREKMKKKVYQYTLEEEFIRAWSSATDAALSDEGFNRSAIYHVCNGYRTHHRGYVWRYN